MINTLHIQMLIKVNDTSYEVIKVKGTTYLRMVVSCNGLCVEFQRIEQGWASLHEKVEDPIFPEDDTWELLQIMDFIYFMKNQLN